MFDTGNGMMGRMNGPCRLEWPVQPIISFPVLNIFQPLTKESIGQMVLG